MEVMYVITSPLGIFQHRRDFGNLGGVVRLIARLRAHFLVGSRHGGIRRFKYQIHRLIKLTSFLDALLSVGPKSQVNPGVRLTTPDVLTTQSTKHNLLRHDLYVVRYIAIRSNK